MNKSNFLNEEKYQNTKGKVLLVSKLVLIVGLLLGGLLLGIGFYKNYQIKNVYPKKIAEKETELKNKKTELRNQIQPTLDEIAKLQKVQFDGFNDAYHERQNEILRLKSTIDPIQNQISEIDLYLNMNWCFNPSITKEVCDLKSETSFKTMPYFMSGGFIMVATLMISGMIYMVAKRREVMAFSLQQVMPVAQEGLEKVAPTVAKVGSQITKEMAPAYGDVAKEISKGIAEGIQESKNNNEK
ncbi:MAG: hypothetical protein E7167_03655 [Firmicutes bacterium]|nr:hypothetical protein [Bacillota bacterium]